jgi:hypothetical protein
MENRCSVDGFAQFCPIEGNFKVETHVAYPGESATEEQDEKEE